MKSKRTQIALLIGILLAGGAAASFFPIPPANRGDSAAFQDRLEERIPALMREHNVPGVAVALVHGDETTWVQAYGFADLASASPVTPDTVFQVGSLSKPVTAWGVMKLVEEGKLDLDAPVTDYLTRWQFPPSGYPSEQVTIRRLLSHTAGLSLSGYGGFHPDDGVQTLEESLTLAEDSGVGVQIISQPGSEWQYSGGGYTLLQLILEEVTGEPFSAYMERTVLDPLGMGDSSFEWLPGLRTTTATGYNPEAEPYPNFIFTAQAAAGLYTTAPDLARWVSAHFPGQSGPVSLLSKETLGIMLITAPNAVVTDGPFPMFGYGLGYNLHIPIPGDDFQLVGHGGSNYGWESAFMVLPARGEGIVILTNGNGGSQLTWQISCDWVLWATGKTVAFCQPTRVPKIAGVVLVGFVLGVLAITGLPKLKKFQG